MGKPITLFSGYSQKENRVTNYCLLILKMLYEENPKFLGEIMMSLVGEDEPSYIGVSFHQQERKGSGVPDGVISQRALTLYLETKNWDWFYDEQLEKHLADLDREATGTKVLVALGNFETDSFDRFESIRWLCEQKYRRSIVFRSLSFEEFLNKLQMRGVSKNVSDAILDFWEFLNEEDLLPTWRRRLDVVNCSGIPQDITEGGAYMCPAEGGAYSHLRSRFFGMYRDKRVELVAEIEAVVDVDLTEDTAFVKWVNVEGARADVQARARSKVEEFRPDAGPTRVFLLGPLFNTDFRKTSPGGMQQSKRYFDISRANAKNADQLARALHERDWADWS